MHTQITQRAVFCVERARVSANTQKSRANTLKTHSHPKDRYRPAKEPFVSAKQSPQQKTGYPNLHKQRDG